VLSPPPGDPVALFETFNAGFGSKLLVAASKHLRLFETLAEGEWSLEDICTKSGLRPRPVQVLITALLALGLLVKRGGRIRVSSDARCFLNPQSAFDVSDYLDLAAEAPGVLRLVESLRTDRPTGTQVGGGGAQFIYRDGLNSAMSDADKARRLTMALAGRAKNTAPILAERLPLDDVGVLLDVAGGTGFFSIAYLQRNPRLRAIVLELPEVVPLVKELSREHGVADRLEARTGDMFRDELPPADVVLLSNVLHDWDVPDCLKLLQRCADKIPVGGRILIHDAFLNDELDGPLPIAIYSVILFFLTEGRAYSLAEYKAWLQSCGLRPVAVKPTLVHCGVLAAVKESS
jgi:hypothetical protein